MYDVLFLFLIIFVVVLALFRRLDDFVFVCFCIVVLPSLVLLDVVAFVGGRFADVLRKL